MSRSMIILVIVLLAIVGGLVWLANVDTEVAPVMVEKAMLNEAAAN